MIKKPPREAAQESKGQGGRNKIWSAIAAGFGALLVMSFLAPADSISVFIGTALPQNLGWLVLATITAFASRKSPLQVRPSRTETAIAVTGLLWLISITWITSQHGNGRAVWNGFWHVMSLACCFYVGRALFQCTPVRSAVVLVLIVGCTAMSWVGLEQVLISLPANRAAYAKDPEKVLAEYGFDAPPGSPRRAQFEDRLNSPEPFANFALANSLASLLCVGVFLSGGLLTGGVLRDRGTFAAGVPKWVAATAAAMILLTQLVCLLLTRSRTAYLSILVAVGIWLVLERMRGRVQLSSRALRYLGFSVGTIAFIGLGWLLTVDRLVWSEAPKSILYRLEYWQATLAMIRDYAWTGVGLGNFQSYYPQYKLVQASEVIADPHNWILDVAATLSIPIAVMTLGWIGVTIAKGIAASLRGKVPAAVTVESDANPMPLPERAIARALFLGAIAGGGLCATMLGLLGNLDLPTNLLAWGLSVVLGWIAYRGADGEGSAANLVAAALALLLCLLSSGSWQAPGIAIPLMILLAILWQSPPLEAASNGRAITPSWLGPLLATTGLLIFVFQTWQPVMRSWTLVESAATARSPDERLRMFELAVAADRWDTERDLQKVQLLVARTIESPDSMSFTADASRVMVELNRVNPPNVVGFLGPKLAAELSSQLAAGAAQRGLPNQDFLVAARGFYSLAVERYPSSVELLVQHAAASALLDDWRSVENSLEKAGQISDQTPHLDKKLAAQMILLPLKPAGYEAQTDYVPAEPLTNWLRTEVKAKLR